MSVAEHSTPAEIMAPVDQAERAWREALDLETQHRLDCPCCSPFPGCETGVALLRSEIRAWMGWHDARRDAGVL